MLFLLGIMAFKLPMLGLMGILIGLLSLTSTISTQTVIMGYMMNNTTNEIITITQKMPEILYIGLIDFFWIIFGTLSGVLIRVKR